MAARDPRQHVFKERLRETRQIRGFSQRDLALAAGVSKSVIEKYESWENERIPNTKQLYRIAEVLRVSLDYLLGRTTDPRLRGSGGTLPRSVWTESHAAE